MEQFLISLLFFIVVLALFWAVLHWIGYKKGDKSCTCGKGACLTDAKHAGKNGHQHEHKKGDCNASECQCDE